MPSIAEQLLQGVQTGISQTGENITRGAQLAQSVQQIQNQRAQLEQQKQELELKKDENIASAFETMNKIKSPTFRKIYAEKVLNNKLKMLKRDDMFDPAILESVQKGDQESLNRILNGITAVRQGKMDYPTFRASLQNADDFVTLDSYEPEFMKAQEAAQDYQERLNIAGVTAANRGQQQNVGNLQDLRKEITAHPVTKATLDMSNSYSRIKRTLTGKPSAAGDMSGIFAYMKMLDPGSTVREGEYAAAENARGVPEQVLGLYNKAVKGEKLTPEQRKDFTSRAEQIYADQYAKQQKLNKQYENIARSTNLDPKLVFAGTEFEAPPKEKAKVPFSVNPMQKQLYNKSSPGDKALLLKGIMDRYGLTEEEARAKMEAP